MSFEHRLSNVLNGWQKANVSGKLKIVGPVIDYDYAKQVFEIIDKDTSVEYIEYMDHPELMNMLGTSYATINSSISEGQSAAVLESMASGVPVIARNIPGNSFIDDQCGLKFDTIDEMSEKIRLIFDDNQLRDQLGQNARSYIDKHHSFENECELYRKLISTVLQT